MCAHSVVSSLARVFEQVLACSCATGWSRVSVVVARWPGRFLGLYLGPFMADAVGGRYSVGRTRPGRCEGALAEDQHVVQALAAASLRTAPQMRSLAAVPVANQEPEATRPLAQ